MAAPMNCCIHVVESEKSDLITLSETSFKKICASTKDWLVLDSVNREAAENLVRECEKLLESHCHHDQHSVAENCMCFECMGVVYGYHRKCYMKYTDKTRIDASKKRVAKQDVVTSLSVDANNPETAGPSTNKRRSSRTKCEARIPDFFPETCLICSKDRYYCEPFSQKRKKEKLMQCLTFNAANLLTLAAQRKNHTEFMSKIVDVDLIAKEAKYHKWCYKEYTKCVRAEPLRTQDGDSGLTEHCDVFIELCETVVVPRILQGNEILRIDDLTKTFEKIVRKKLYNAESVTYRNHQLKRRLKTKYPQLLFVKPKRGCELVMSEFEENAPRVVVCAPNADEENSSTTGTETDQTDTDVDYTVEIDSGKGKTKFSENALVYHDGVRTLYSAALFLRTLIKEVETGVKNWPPGSDDLNDDSVSKTIPPMLFNFLAWCTGESEDVEFKNFVMTSAVMSRKLSSIAQDIIYIASKGKKQTPKHLVLGMTIRHLTGSSKLIGLLNGLGHCISHTSALEFDTALAEKQVMNDGGIPDGTKKNTFTTLVWDNNDFGEETLTGHGTTHNTNGIIVQRAVDSEEVLPSETMKRSRKRTVEAPSQDIHIYHGGKKSGPAKASEMVNMEDNSVNHAAKYTDMAFIISKLTEVKGKLLPGWTGFNTRLSEVQPLSNVGYLPIVDASPTQMNTVYTILLRSVRICDLLELPCIVVVFDQAIYAKAQQIRWRPENAIFRKRLAIRLGAFHFTGTIMAVLGKRFKDAGLRDILIESELVAEGSINGVLSGHHYNRCIRVYKILYEALLRLLWSVFLDSLSTEEYAEIVGLAYRLNGAFPTSEFSDITNSDQFKAIVRKFEAFLNEDHSPTFTFWRSFLEIVQAILLFVRATRDGDWQLHLSSMRTIIPWFFAYDRTNYARYAPAYWIEMTNLETTHPYAHEHLMAGDFSVQRQSLYGFAKVAFDQTIEQTVNRGSKTKGGLTGITLSKGAVHRWVLANPARALISLRCEEMAGKSESTRPRKDLDKTRMDKDEAAVQNVMATIESMTNPFTTECEGLISISSGIVAQPAVQNDLLRAHDLGEATFVAYIKERLTVSDENEKMDIFTPIPLQKLKTFSNHLQSCASKDKVKAVSMKANSDLLGRVLMVSQVRKIDVKETMTYALNPYPPAIAQYGGAPVKTNKAALMNHILQTNSADLIETDTVTNPNLCGVWIFDGMAVLQQLKDIPGTFQELADKVLTNLLTIARRFGVRRVDFVTDCYPELSVKDCERSRRASSGVQQVKIMRGDQKTPKQFKKYLSSGKNKEALVEYMFTEWSKSPPEKLNNIQVFISHGQKCHSLSVQDGVLEALEVPELVADHEEADTRMFLHASHASHTYDNIIIRSADTDVFVIGLFSARRINSQLYMHTGPWSEPRIIPLSCIANKIGEDVCDALIGLHCFTGCDSVSAFKGKGKVKAMKLMENSELFKTVFAKVGRSWTLADLDMTDIESFVCELYGKPGLKSTNDARYDIFRRSYKTDTTLPPNQTCLKYHTMRANYQAGIHRRCLQSLINAPSPVDNGWASETSGLSIVWNTEPIAPESIMKLVACSCKKFRCVQGNCSCKTNGIHCSELCNCVDCENSGSLDDEDDGNCGSDTDSDSEDTE